MITDTILHKYMRHMRYIDQGGIVHIDAVELALRLALEELAASTPSIPSTPSMPSLHTAGYDALAEQLIRLNKWCAHHAPDDLNGPGSTADVVLCVLNRQRTEIAEMSAAIQQLEEMLRHSDVAPSTISNQQSPINNSMWDGPDMLHLLDDVARDWWIGVAAGRHAWRTVPKPIQLQLVRHVLSFGPETGSMKQTEFDDIKPDWMPSSGSHTKTLSLSWQQLNDWSVEL